MIRCIRLWTGDDDNSYFEEGLIDLSEGERGDSQRHRRRLLASRSARLEPGRPSNGTTRRPASSSSHSAARSTSRRTGEHFTLHPATSSLPRTPRNRAQLEACRQRALAPGLCDLGQARRRPRPFAAKLNNREATMQTQPWRTRTSC